jgi:hypothetical protein
MPVIWLSASIAGVLVFVLSLVVVMRRKRIRGSFRRR